MAAIIGEASAWLIILIVRNLAIEMPGIAVASRYINYLPIIFPILCAVGLIIARVLSKITAVFYQLAKFALVGGLNFLIDMGALNFLIFYTGISSGLAQTGFKGISFFAAVINSYFWNKFWTFKRSTTEKAGKEFLQFFIVSIIGFAINLGIDYVIVNMITPFAGLQKGAWAQFGALLAAVVALAWNFAGYKFIVFENKPRAANGQMIS